MIKALFSIICLALMAGAVDLRAQEGEEEEFVSERLPYFGLGAGYMRLFLLPDYGPFNTVSRELGLGDFNGPVNMDVFGLIFTPGIFPNLRAGFYGGLGTKQLTRQVTLDNTLYTRTMFFTNVFGAIQLDYAVQISSAFTIFPGMALGYGRGTIGASQTRNSGTHFFDVFDGPLFLGDSTSTFSNLNRFARALSYHIFLYPTVNLEYTFTPNIMMRAGAGYNTSLRVTPWSDEGGVELLDAPAVSANGFAIQLGIFVGLFQH